MVNNLQKSFILGLLSHLVDLVYEGNRSQEFLRNEFVVVTHDDNFLLSFHCFLGQVSGLVIKKSVRVSRPGYALHQDTKTSQVAEVTYICD